MEKSQKDGDGGTAGKGMAGQVVTAQEDWGEIFRCNSPNIMVGSGH